MAIVDFSTLSATSLFNIVTQLIFPFCNPLEPRLFTILLRTNSMFVAPSCQTLEIAVIFFVEKPEQPETHQIWMYRTTSQTSISAMH